MDQGELRKYAIGLFLMGVAFLCSQFVTSLASNARVDLVEEKVNMKLDHVLNALCIIDERTCKIGH